MKRLSSNPDDPVSYKLGFSKKRGFDQAFDKPVIYSLNNYFSKLDYTVLKTIIFTKLKR